MKVYAFSLDKKTTEKIRDYARSNYRTFSAEMRRIIAEEVQRLDNRVEQKGRRYHMS